MMRNNVQRLGEHVTAALRGQLTTPQPRERGDTAGGRRFKQDPAYMLRWQDRGQFPYGCACPWSVTLTQPRESPGSGDDLSPGWRQAWARRESWHGRQGTCS